MSLSLIVPVHNHWQTTAKCLISIFKSDIPYEYKVVIINDASTDQTQSLLDTITKEKRPIEIIQNETNIGYVLSTNRGLKELNTDFVLFLNNDIYLDKNCIKTLVENFKKYPDIGILGAIQYDDNWNETSALKFFLRGEKATIRDHIISSVIPKDLKESEVIYCDIANLACALTSKDIIDKVGFYDEQFSPANYEQEDFCLRIKELPRQVAVCPKAKFIHYCTVSIMDNIGYYSKILDRNRNLFHEKWGPKLKENKV